MKNYLRICHFENKIQFNRKERLVNTPQEHREIALRILRLKFSFATWQKKFANLSTQKPTLQD
jgi:hypothetical protein